MKTTEVGERVAGSERAAELVGAVPDHGGGAPAGPTPRQCDQGEREMDGPVGHARASMGSGSIFASAKHAPDTTVWGYAPKLARDPEPAPARAAIRLLPRGFARQGELGSQSVHRAAHRRFAAK